MERNNSMLLCKNIALTFNISSHCKFEITLLPEGGHCKLAVKCDILLWYAYIHITSYS